MQLKKINRKKYFNKDLLEITAQGFSEEEVIICSKIIAEEEKLIACHKALNAYIEGDSLRI